MSGHSKWSQIKRQKGVTDARRGQLFTKLAREITVAARQGGGNPAANYSLRLAVQKARDSSMPLDNIDRALKQAKATVDKGAAIASADDRHYSAIRADNLLSGNKTIFDIYIRLPSGQYLKVIHAGDAFDVERLEGYLRKGVIHFYIRKEVHETYLRYCHHLTSRLVRAPTAPLEVKISQTLNHGQETLSFLAEHRFGEPDLHQVSNFVSNVQELFLQFNPRSNEVMSKFLEDLVLYEHAVGTTMVGCLLGRGLKFESWYALHILGMSCLLHDVGLQGSPDHFKDEDEARLTEAELAEFRKHPEIGAGILKLLPDLAPTVAQAALQHHVRRNRKGYPSLPRGESVHVVSEIVGLSDEFCQLIKRSTIDTGVNPLKEMKERVLSGFSKPVQDAFREAFLKKLTQS